MIINWENWPKENEDDLFFCIFEVGGDQLMGGLFLNEVPDVSNVTSCGSPVCVAVKHEALPQHREDCVASWRIDNPDQDAVPFLAPWQLQGTYGWVQLDMVSTTMQEHKFKSPFKSCDHWMKVRVD